MEAERLYTKQPSRTIQQKRGGEGALEMVDNRPAGILQLGRANASTVLKANLYKIKKNAKKPHIEKWAKGREAQHIIPYAVGKFWGIDESLLNSAANGIMIPSGRAKTIKKFETQILSKELHYLKKKFIRVNHIKKGVAHKAYNDLINSFCLKLYQEKLSIKDNFYKIAYAIRIATKQLNSDQAVDDMNMEMLNDAWKLLNDRKSLLAKTQELSQNGNPNSKHLLF